METHTARGIQDGPPLGAVTVTVALESDPLIEWRGKVIALERSRVKVKLGTEKPSPRDGSSVSLRLDSLKRESPPPLRGMVCGIGPDGVITVLPSLTTEEFNQIKAFLSGQSAPAQPAPRKHKGAPPAALVPPRVQPVAPSPKAAAPAPAPPRVEPVAPSPKAAPPAVSAPPHVQPVAPSPKAAPPAVSVTPRVQPVAPSPKAAPPVVSVTPRVQPVAPSPKAAPPAVSVTPRVQPVAPSPKAAAPAPAPPRPEPVAPSPKATPPAVSAPPRVEPVAPSPKAAAPAPAPPRVEPVAPSPKAAAPAPAPPAARQTDEELLEASITKEERERALVALMQEGRKMPMSRPELIAKVVEMRKKPNWERRSASTKK